MPMLTVTRRVAELSARSWGASPASGSPAVFGFAELEISLTPAPEQATLPRL
jgi:hypothetical protein